MGERFNPAPGWPVPPRGFVPAPGWRPDPSWPEAPPGWQFWVDDDYPEPDPWPEPEPSLPYRQRVPRDPDESRYRGDPIGPGYERDDDEGPAGYPGSSFVDDPFPRRDAAHWPGAGPSQRAGQAYRSQRYARSARTSGWAIASFVLGLVGVSLLGLIFGIVALVRLNRIRERGRGLAIAGIVLSCCWTAVFAVAGAAVLSLLHQANSPRVAASGGPGASGAPGGSGSGQPGTGLFSLRVGDCFDIPPGQQDISGTITLITCTNSHNAQVFAIFTPTGLGSGYPGDKKFTSVATQGCDARTTDLDQAKLTSDMLQFSGYPTLVQWDLGNRKVTCVIQSPKQALTASLLSPGTTP